MFAVAYRNTEAGIRRRMAERMPPKPEPTKPAPAKIVMFPASPEQQRIERERCENLAALNRPPVPRLTSARELIARVAAWHGMTLDDVIAPDRRVPVVAARVDAIAAVWCNCLIEGARPTTCALGRVFKRDHATVLHALRKAGLKPREVR